MTPKQISKFTTLVVGDIIEVDLSEVQSGKSVVCLILDSGIKENMFCVSGLNLTTGQKFDSIADFTSFFPFKKISGTRVSD